jgi:hypothetical protein
MKSVFAKESRDELINRINLLNENSTPQWGKMNVSQMIKHCTQWDEMALGKRIYKQSFIGKLFGKMALKDMMKDEPIKRNLPTVPSFKIKENGNVEDEESKLINSINEYASFSNENFIHPFFGRMTKENTGIMIYKHVDHHLKQFNC